MYAIRSYYAYSFEYNNSWFSRFSYQTDYWGLPCAYDNGSPFKTNYYTYSTTSDLFPNKYSILPSYNFV